MSLVHISFYGELHGTKLLASEARAVGVGDSSPTNAPVVQRLARPAGIKETRGSIPGLALSFRIPHVQ